MAKTEVYSWRLSSEMKQLLAAAAREESTSIADLLERIAGDWLRRHVDEDEEERQRTLHEAVLPCLGSLAGGDPTRSRRVRERVLEKLEGRRRARSP